MKMLWSGIKSILNIKTDIFYNISQIVHNGKVINNPRDMAQAFNHDFINIATKVDEEIPRTRKPPFGYLGKVQKLSLFLSPTDASS